MRTWMDVFRFFNLDIREDVADYILWNETAYPFSDVRQTLGQIKTALRAHKSDIRLCEFCGANEKYHKSYCLDK